MDAKTIKISEDNYRLLVERSAELSKAAGKPVSLDRALGATLRSAPKGQPLTGLAALKGNKELQTAFDWVLQQRGKYKMRDGAW